MPTALPAGPFTAAALVLVTLPHHWRVGNIATLSIIAWLTAYNLIYGINAMIWSGNVDKVAPVWCDIVTKIKIGADMGLPCCSLCVAMRLNRIAYGLAEMSPHGWWHRTLDIVLCWGLSMLVMVLHYIVQGHRFDIVENIGCWPAVYYSWPSLIIVNLSAIIPALLTLFFCLFALSKLIRQRPALFFVFHKRNPSLTPSLTPSRYIRLMSMTFVLGSWSAVVISLTKWPDYNGLLPWVSWDYVHAGFSFIGQYTTDDISLANLRSIYFAWGSIPLSSLWFFIVFGLGADAMKDYRACATWVGQVVFRRPAPTRAVNTTIARTVPSRILAINTTIDSESDQSYSSYGGRPEDPEKYGQEYGDGPGALLYLNKCLPPLPGP